MCGPRIDGRSALGFQLITVFNPFLFERLDAADRAAHFAALCLLTLAAALVMTPAAYHRQARPDSLSRRFVRMTSTLLSVAMVPMMCAFCLNLYLVAHLMFGSRPAAVAVSAGFLVVFAGMWFVFPHVRRLARLREARSDAASANQDPPSASPSLAQAPRN